MQTKDDLQGGQQTTVPGTEITNSINQINCVMCILVYFISVCIKSVLSVLLPSGK